MCASTFACGGPKRSRPLICCASIAQRVEERSHLLENPEGRPRVLDFFVVLFTSIASDLRGHRGRVARPRRRRTSRRPPANREQCRGRTAAMPGVSRQVHQPAAAARASAVAAEPDLHRHPRSAARLRRPDARGRPSRHDGSVTPPPNPRADNVFDRRALFARFLPKRD